MVTVNLIIHRNNVMLSSMYRSLAHESTSVCSVLSFPVLVTCAGIFGEYQKVYYFDRHKEIGFIVFLTVLLFM